jgi:hypothetical protein
MDYLNYDYYHLIHGGNEWSPPLQLLQYGHASLMILEEVIISSHYVNHIHPIINGIGTTITSNVSTNWLSCIIIKLYTGTMAIIATITFDSS